MINDFSADDLAIASNGWIDNKRLQNWAARSLWLTPTMTPEPGRAKRYSLNNLRETIIASALRKYGFSDETARAVIKHRLRVEYVRPTGGGWADEYIARFGDLPEWKGEVRFWVIALQPSDEHWGQIANTVIGCKTAADVAKLIVDIPYAIVFDVAFFIDEALERLQERAPS